MAFYLRPLNQSDLKLLHKWLNEPHMFPFFTSIPLSQDQIKKKYGPRLLKNHEVNCLIAIKDGHPFGYGQWYFNQDFPEYSAIIKFETGISIDYFIGEPRFLGLNLGSQLLKTLVQQSARELEPEDHIFCIGHDDRNSTAIRCTKRAGFTAEKAFVEDGNPSTLFVKRNVPVLHR